MTSFWTLAPIISRRRSGTQSASSLNHQPKKRDARSPN
jgi:hypothetical protein